MVQRLTPARVAFITRFGEGMIPNVNTVLQEGDLVHIMVHESDLAAVEAALAQSPEEA